jgi:hypothetical protein
VGTSGVLLGLRSGWGWWVVVVVGGEEDVITFSCTNTERTSIRSSTGSCERLSEEKTKLCLWE